MNFICPNNRLDDIKLFVSNHQNGNIFQTPEMYNIYRKMKLYRTLFLVVEENGEIVGVLLVVIQKEYPGILGGFTARSIIWGGPLVKNNDSFILDFILKEYNHRIKSKVIYSQFRNLWEWSVEEKEIFVKNGFYYIEHLDIIHNIALPLEQQLLKMSKSRRKNIKRAEASNLLLEEVTNRKVFNEALSLVIENYNRIKLPLPEDLFFLEVFEKLTKKGMLKTFILRYNREIIGVRMVLCFNSLIYDWYAGSSSNHLNKHPNDYLPWKIMEWGHKNNFNVFDFGGAGKPNITYGVREYKLKFGGNLVEWGRFEIVHKQVLMYLGKIGIKLRKSKLNGLFK